MKENHYLKHYGSASERFLENDLKKFIQREFPKFGGPMVIKMFIKKLLERLSQLAPDVKRVKPGQAVWNALDLYTRASNPNKRFKPVILTLISEEDIEKLKQGESLAEILPEVIARMLNEAKVQGGILSMRDLSLLLLRSHAQLSQVRIKHEKEKQIILPHTGSLHDQGTTLTHKDIICRKVIFEKKDPSIVAREVNHSQEAVDRYLKDFKRVRMIAEHTNDINYISYVTGMSRHLIKQYLKLINKIQPSQNACHMT